MNQSSKPAKAKRRSVKSKTSNAWTGLTWDDLTAWAGQRSVQRGRTYQRQGRVKDLVQTGDGQLLATVTGGERYTVSVKLTQDGRHVNRLESQCTCPVGSNGCKHAVATVAAYLGALAQDIAVPAADADDPRWTRLAGENVEDDAWDGETERRLDGIVHRGDRRTDERWDELIQSHIRGQSKKELADLVWSLVERFPELRSEFQERLTLAEGDVNRILAEARREMRRATSETGWQNYWDHEGYTPDYTKLRHRLERLVEMDRCSEVAELGRELLRRGFEQVGQSHDEGETGMALSECLSIVFDAVKRSNMPAADKLMYAIDAALLDDYSVIDEESSVILHSEWPPEAWSSVADRLTERLQGMPTGDDGDFSSRYQRDGVSNWLLDALRLAGRNGELATVYETEARQTGSYQRLVAYLLEEGRFDDAHHWACEGIEKTREAWPGVSSSLTKSLGELARRRRQWDVVAAHVSAAFFTQPSARGFAELIAAAKRAKCEKQVQTMARTFLETGVAPIRAAFDSNGKPSWTVAADWPLPMPDYLVPSQRANASGRNQPQPHPHVLLDIAIENKRPDEVLHWYDQLVAAAQSQRRSWGWSSGIGEPAYDDRVAQSVAATHPDRALEIYRRGLDANLPRADIHAYETCADYLRKMKPVFHALDRDGDWTALLADVRQRYRNRPRFMEILDRFDGRTIVHSKRAARRK